MTDLVLTRAMEERMLNAWPAVETLVAGDWLLRFANGYSKRANSATTLREGGDMDEAMIDHVMARADQWGVPATIRLSPLCADGLDARLAARGFDELDFTCGMIGDLTEQAIDPRARFSATPAPEWIAANAASYGGVKSDAARLRAILERIRPQAAFATLIEENVAIAWGIGAVERGLIGLQDITVAPAHRGRGAGRALVQSLMAWGAENGAARAYLHVLQSNESARALYRRLGFSDVYQYRHRMFGAP